MDERGFVDGPKGPKTFVSNLMGVGTLERLSACLWWRKSTVIGGRCKTPVKVFGGSLSCSSVFFFLLVGLFFYGSLLARGEGNILQNKTRFAQLHVTVTQLYRLSIENPKNFPIFTVRRSKCIFTASDKYSRIRTARFLFFTPRDAYYRSFSRAALY